MLKYLIASIFFFSTMTSFAQTSSETGLASYYADKFQGSKTASGELYDKDLMTAAHKKFKMGTIVKVTRLDNNKSVIVRINDRGPYYKNRVIDLSRKAAASIDLIDVGSAMVKVEEVSKPDEFSKKTTKKKSAKSAPKTVNVNDPKVSPYGLFKVSSERLAAKGFAVQIGSYSDYKQVLKQVDILQQQGVVNVVVSIVKQNNKDIYKLLSGPYGKRESAEATKNMLRRKGFKNCFVVSLAPPASKKEKKKK